MIKVGVTGGIGSGKTTVCKILEELNYPVYYADDRAKWILTNNEGCRKQVVKLFGKESYLADNSLNRKYLAELIFGDKKNVENLNKIVHPLVDQDFQLWLVEHSENDLVFKEAALLFETGGNKNVDITIVVDAPEQIRIERVLKRDKHRTEEQVRNIIAEQMPQKEKNEMADYLIDNSEGDLKDKILKIVALIK